MPVIVISDTTFKKNVIPATFASYCRDAVSINQTSYHVTAKIAITGVRVDRGIQSIKKRHERSVEISILKLLWKRGEVVVDDDLVDDED